MSDQQAAAQQDAPQPVFAMQRIYLSDASFEAPNSPDAFLMKEQPRVNVDLGTRHRQVNEIIYEVTVKITVTVTTGEKTAYLAEVQQSGAFHIEGIEGDALEHTLGAFCPSSLFPYAREAIDNLIVKGGFPPLMLAPFNFDALFAEKKKREAQQGATTQ
ncbi:protein-export chaperone SecB [Marinospirillum sp.]|uniref:protein-export chaperone SecB n=1 Tax=Marinospirillum sp. TaxID=2183934 RepID=UPI003A8A8F00